nr:hypothetical protein [Tanacetum cinerariifolium]
MRIHIKKSKASLSILFKSNQRVTNNERLADKKDEDKKEDLEQELLMPQSTTSLLEWEGSLEVIPSSKEVKFKCLRLLKSKLEEKK